MSNRLYAEAVDVVPVCCAQVPAAAAADPGEAPRARPATRAVVIGAGR